MTPAAMRRTGLRQRQGRRQDDDNSTCFGCRPNEALLMEKPSEFPEGKDFSLVLGGPLYQLLMRCGLLTPSLDLVSRRILAFVLITWAPLALLTALGGLFWSGAAVPFLFDLDVHARFLISLPMLIGAELLVHQRVRATVYHFRDCDLIAPNDVPRFKAIIDSAWRMRNSVLAELLILVLAFTLGHWLWRTRTALATSAWYAAPAGGATHYTWAGYWYTFISLPIARFVLLRWYFRLLLWYIFLWRVSRLRLQLNPMHPDRAGGLAFLSDSVSAFIPVLVAQTVLLAAVIGNQIWHQGAKLPTFAIMIVVFIASLMLAVLLPTVFFLIQMAMAKWRGLREQDLLASRYVNDFRQKWLVERRTDDTELLGSADIQSLADLGNSYEVIRQMKLLPMDMRVVLRLAIILALPLLPLLLTMFPLEEIVSRLIKIVL